MSQAPSLRELGRSLREALSHPAGRGAPLPALDLSGLITEPPSLRASTLVEGERLATRAVGDGEVGFAAFLDGIQASHVEDYAETIPIVAGRTAAVIRIRVDRRLATWGDGPLALARLYAPIQLLAPALRDAIAGAGLEIRDTLRANEEVSGHPLELMRRAVDAVKDDREGLERDLAETWAARMTAPLYVDGGLPLGALASASDWCVGVVKSHHTLYLPADGLAVVMRLREGERTTACLIERTWGPKVVSWYLRLRQPPTHDPFLGLVRVEVSQSAALDSPAALSARADEVSRWILAERSPLSLPDARWDRMVYGVYDCEQYLRATTA